MSLKLPQAPNSGLFKQGYSSFSNADGAIIRNVEAVREIASILLTSMGPSGRNKIIVNKLGKNSSPTMPPPCLTNWKLSTRSENLDPGIKAAGIRNGRQH